MRDERFKVEVANGWLAQPRQGSNMTRLAKRIEGLGGQLLEFRKQIKRSETNKGQLHYPRLKHWTT